jgi:hypothetical protein
MSDMISPDPESSIDTPGDRRNFLSRSALAFALLALAGGEGVADAAAITSLKGPVLIPQSDLPVLNTVLNAAIAAGSLNVKSPTFLKLIPASQGALQGLTSADLVTLRAAQGIIAGHLQLPNADDNNGTIGM